MPTIDIDLFDEAPKVGDKIKVTGKVESIDESTGEVDVSYGDVSIIKGRKRNKRDDDEETVEFTETVDEMGPNSQSLDAALSRSFPNTQ